MSKTQMVPMFSRPAGGCLSGSVLPLVGSIPKQCLSSHSSNRKPQFTELEKHSPAERCVEFEIPCTNQYLIKAGSSHFIQEKLRDGQMRGFLYVCTTSKGRNQFQVLTAGC